MWPRTPSEPSLDRMRTTNVSRAAASAGGFTPVLSTLGSNSGRLDGKGDDGVANVDLIVVRKLLLCHRGSVDTRAVGAVQVLDPEVAILAADARVVARDLSIVNERRV